MSLQQRECGIHALYGEPDWGGAGPAAFTGALAAGRRTAERNGSHGRRSTIAEPGHPNNGQAASAPGGTGAWRDRGEPVRRR